MIQSETTLRASLVRRGWLLREIRLMGAIEATVTYNGWGIGFEMVLVNGRIATREVGSMALADHFEFTVPTPEGEVPASLDLAGASPLSFRGLRLRVGDAVVYAEGAFGQVGETRLRGDLPVPAAAPAAPARTLPVPAAPPAPDGERLPVPVERPGSGERGR